MYMRGGMGKYQGLKRYRPMRGLTQGQCPGDPSCPGYPFDQNQMIGTPLSPSQLSAMSIGNAAMFGGTPQPGAQGSLSPTQWLNTNAITIVAGTVVFLVAWKALSK